MTRDEMIEKLVKHIAPKLDIWEAAAAVLDLCGPKPLAWVETGTNRYSAKNFDAKVITDGNNWATCPEDWPPFGGYPHPTLEAAQAAAQAHADAAHWANTPLGDT